MKGVQRRNGTRMMEQGFDPTGWDGEKERARLAVGNEMNVVD